jgi:uncharacterized coiled-coil DUF342 family protein
LEESRQKIMQMEEQLSCHAVRLLLAKTKIQELTAERDQLHIEKEILLAERQQFAEQVSALTQQRDDLSYERDARTAERDQLHVERDIGLSHIADLEAHQQRTTDECNSLRAQYLSQQNRLDQINQELDEILALINTNTPSDADSVIPSQ